MLDGPEGSPYNGGKFHLDVQIDADYPTSPPSIKFTTRICHTNIDSEKGDIELDVLAEKWKPQMTILSALTAIVALLLKPEPFKLQNPSAEAILYKKDYFEYQRKATLWTKIYA